MTLLVDKIHIHICFFLLIIKVILQNNESMTSQISSQIYKAPAGRKYA